MSSWRCWCYHGGRWGGVLFLRRRWRKATGGIESLTPVTSTRLLPCSLATHKDFSCHSLACNHEWAQGPRNPITSMASDACRHVLESNPPLVIFAFFASLPVSQLSLGLEHATLAPMAPAGGCLMLQPGRLGRAQIKWLGGVDPTEPNIKQQRPHCQIHPTPASYFPSVQEEG